jgi:type II secretory ATPase GspE/PulE/Tfp pilus assembly ATPase PilB-like protein
MQSMTEMDESDVELQSEQEEIGLADLEKAADEAPIVKLVNMVLTEAVKRRSQRHSHGAIRKRVPRPPPY